jgi:hypothetical protein
MKWKCSQNFLHNMEFLGAHFSMVWKCAEKIFHSMEIFLFRFSILWNYGLRRGGRRAEAPVTCEARLRRRDRREAIALSPRLELELEGCGGAKLSS